MTEMVLRFLVPTMFGSPSGVRAEVDIYLSWVYFDCYVPSILAVQ